MWASSLPGTEPHTTYRQEHRSQPNGMLAMQGERQRHRLELYQLGDSPESKQSPGLKCGLFIAAVSTEQLDRTKTAERGNVLVFFSIILPLGNVSCSQEEIIKSTIKATKIPESQTIVHCI